MRAVFEGAHLVNMIQPFLSSFCTHGATTVKLIVRVGLAFLQCVQVLDTAQSGCLATFAHMLDAM